MTVNENLPMEFTFNSTNQAIRVEMVNKQPYFIAKDVCEALALTDVGKTVERLDDDEKLTRTVFVSGQNRKMWCINESGLYNLIFQSRKPEAKAFRKWVTAEVLPAIRITGAFVAKELHEKKNLAFSGRLADFGGFVDLRDVMYDAVELNGQKVRHIIYEDCDYYSVNDVVKAVYASTCSSQIAKKLNAKKTMAIKFWVFGNTHPSWFCKSTGLGLILSGSRVLKNKQLQLIIPTPQTPVLEERRAAS